MFCFYSSLFAFRWRERPNPSVEATLNDRPTLLLPTCARRLSTGRVALRSTPPHLGRYPRRWRFSCGYGSAVWGGRSGLPYPWMTVRREGAFDFRTAGCPVPECAGCSSG